MSLNAYQRSLLSSAVRFFNGHDAAIGVLLIPGAAPAFIKSGFDGGPWGGTQRGGIPRGKGWGFTQGGQSQGNISTHVEGHAVAILWQRGIRRATLIVDRPMCSICARDLPQTLAPGTTLMVISEEEGETLVRSSHYA